MVFQRSGKRIWEVKVTHPTGRSAILSCGTSDKDTAEGVVGVLAYYRRKRRWDVFDLLITKRVKLPALFDAFEQGTEAADAMIQRALVTPVVIDLRPFLEPWQKDRESKKKRGAAVVSHYVQIIDRVLYKEQPLTTVTFTKDEIKNRIDARQVEPATKTKSKAAVTQFAKYLLERKVIDTDPTIGLPTWGEGEARESYKDALDAQKFILSRPEPFRSVEAFQYAFAAEWSAVERLTAADMQLDNDPAQIRVRGTKNRHRDRWVPLVEELDWVLPILKAVVKGKMGDAPIFPGMVREHVLRSHQTAERKQGVPVTTLHDWRHTHAVALLRWGYDEQIVASHLGHKTTDEVRETYGRWIPKRADYAKKKPRENTLEVTSKIERVK